MTKTLGTVVVLGGSVSGLLAAAVAARYARRVVVIERDALDGAVAQPRKGVPQGRHNHNLFAGGLTIMERLLPGLKDELRARGASVIDVGDEGRWTIAGHRLARAPVGHDSLFSSRPCLDAALLTRLRTLPNVSFADRTDVLGLEHDGARVRGVRTASRDEARGDAILEADLVIDATGRGSRTPKWLEALGYRAPPTEALEVRVAYATRTFARPPTALDGVRSILIAGVPPSLPRGGVAFAVEGDRWMVLLFGYGGARPPLELEGFRAYARALAAPDIAELVERAAPLDEGTPFTYPRAARRRYDQVPMPEGLLVIGDAMVSTNPSWGAGMSSAALQADALDRELARGARRLSRRWHRAAIAASSPIWMMTTSNDLAFDCVEGRPPAPLRGVHAYVRALCAAATEDPVLARAMMRVVDRVASDASIFAPSIALRVLRARWRQRASRDIPALPARDRADLRLPAARDGVPRSISERS